jgi:polyhydroxyalkanoate synthase
MQKHHGEPDDEAQPYKIGNAEELSLNLLRLFEQGGRVLTEFIERADSKSGPYSAAAEITEATNTLSDLAQHWARSCAPMPTSGTTPCSACSARR